VLGVIAPGHQFGQRGLAGTGRADDRGERSTTRAKRDVTDQVTPAGQRQTEQMHVQAIDIGHDRLAVELVRKV
jgi:hypothetical protein